MKDIADELSRLSPAKRDLLQKLLREKLAKIPIQAAQVIHRRPDQETRIPTIGQQQLWFMDQLEPGNPSSNIWFAGRLEGPLRLAAFERSLQEIVRRQEILRTTFTSQEGNPIPVVAPLLNVAVPIVHLVDIPKGEQEDEVKQLLQHEVRNPFNLAHSPLLRALLLRLKADEHLLLLTMHHIVSDGWSMNVLMRELAALYNAFVVDMPSPLPKLPIQYADFAFWQRQWLQDKVLKTQLAYWAKQLNGIVPVGLPTDYPRPAIQTFNGACRSSLLPHTLHDGLKALRQKEEVTLFILLLASFQTLLYRYTGQTDIAVGTPIADRARPEVEGLIGYFIQTLVIRTDLSGNPTFLALLERVAQVVREAFAHQDVPFAQLVAEFQPERRLSHPPLFQVMLRLQDASMLGIDYTLADLTLSTLSIDRTTSQLDVTFEMLETHQGLTVTVEYNTDLFAENTITRLLEHWQILLEGIVAAPQTPLLDLPLLSKAERQRLLIEWNATWAEEPSEQCLHKLFEKQVMHTPEAIAVGFEEAHLSYGELNRRANVLAHFLRKCGAGPATLVALCVDRSLDMLVGLLGILKSDAAYVPLDPSYPKERLAFMLTDSQAPLLLTQQHLLDALPATSAHTVVLDTQWSEIVHEPEDNPTNAVSGEELATATAGLAYVIYTSGSTGQPKGVQISHRALLNFLSAMLTQPGLQAHDTLLAVTSLSFDIAGLELYLPLLAGGRILLASQQEARDGRLLADLLASGAATMMQATPATWRLLLEAGWQGDRHLRILCGGEALPPDLARQLLARGAALWNLYGPTETTIWSLTQQVESVERAIPIGRPLANTQVYVLDTQWQHVPIGVAGDLYIGGAGLARGYLHRPELTAQRFLPDPFSREPGQRLYHTGDRARYLPDGTLEFLGRSDQQIKLRGYRIELGEIEAVLAQHPGVRQSVAALREDEHGDPRLVAYVVAHAESSPAHDGQQPLTLGSLRGFLASKLPEYMLPSAVVCLSALPLTPNGKVDRKALPAPDRVDVERQGLREALRTPTEELLADIWAHVLGVDQIRLHDNFFAIGGHSLLATQLAARARDLFGVDLPVRAIFELPTVAALAETIDLARHKREPLSALPLIPGRRDEQLPLSFAQQRLWFLDQLEPEGTAYLIPSAQQLQGVLDTAVLERSLQELVRRHESLRTTFQLYEEQPVQVIHPAGLLRVPLIDLEGLEPDERARQARWLAGLEAGQPCDLARGPLLRARLLRLYAQKHVLLVTMHHIISDGWSNDVFLRELVLLYRAFASGQSSPLPPLPIQYADFAIWQRQWLQGEVLETQLAYWRQQLAGAPPLELPTDYPRPPVQTFHGAHQAMQLPPPLGEQLTSLSRRENVTLFMLLLAAFDVLLTRYTGQTDICVGTPIANRTRSETEGLIGFFVNTLVLRTDLSDNPSFAEVLSRVREVALQAYIHQDVPFEQLVEVLQLKRDLSRSPLFQVMFSMVQQESHINEAREGFTITALDIENTATKFDLTVIVVNNAQGLHCGVEYNTDLFEADTISRLLNHWQTLLQGILTQPEQCLAELPLLSESERHQLLVEWNNAQVARTQGECLHHIFEQQVVQTPDAVALVYEEEQLTYAQLSVRANQLAHYLCQMGVALEEMVGLCLERSPDLLIGLLGILKAGGAYVPLDPSYPSDRLAFILADAHISIVVTSQAVLASTRLTKEPITFICLDSDASTLAEQCQESPQSLVHAEQLAYVIYTSGSTGTPKGALISHMNVLRLFTMTQRWFHFQAEDVWTLFHSYAFDFSVWEIWGALLYGGRLVIVPYWVSRSPHVFSQLLLAEGVTVLNQTPTAFRQLIQAEETKLPGEELALRLVIFGGEALDLASLQPWVTSRGDRKPQLVNMYGITETTVHVTYRPLTQADLIAGQGSVIGGAIPDLQLYILDAYQRPVPIGIPGELYVGGKGLARGYLHRAELTAVRFVPHPFSREQGARLYRTGDLARYRATGDIEYLGRIDRQVKLHGYRIELGEIEAVLAKHPAVRDSVVLVREDSTGDKRLVAYIVPMQLSSLHIEDLRRDLHKQLPEYMLPAAFVPLESIPLTTNGKIDQQSLPAPGDIVRTGQELVAPRTEIERLLAAIWSQILHIEQVGVHDNFFAAGGDSILSIQIVSRARQAGLHITPKLLFLHQTIAQLATVIAEEHFAPLITAGQGQVTGEVPLTPIQCWFFAQQLSEPHHFNQAVLLSVQRPLNLALLERAFHHLLLQHDALRLRFLPQGEQRWLQAYASEKLEAPLTFVSLEELSEAEQQAVLRTRDAELQANLNLQQGPVLRVLYFNLGIHQQPRILIVIHHLVVDGVSWRILLEDLQTAYEHLTAGQGVQLPAKTTSFQQWAQYLYAYAQEEELREESNYWQRLPGHAGLPTDEVQTADTATPIRTITYALSREETQALLYEVPHVYHTQINDILLTAFAQAIASWTGEDTVLFHLEGHGRESLFEDVDLSRTVGWFTGLYPVSLDLTMLSKHAGPGIWLKTVKEQLRTIPRNGIGYGILRYLCEDTFIAKQIQALPQPEMSFNYLGQFDQVFSEETLFAPAPQYSGSIKSPRNRRAHLLDVDGSIVGGQLQLNWTYSQHIHRTETIIALAQCYQQALRALITHCCSAEAGGYTPADFPLVQLSQQQLDALLERQLAVEDIYPLSPLQEGLLFHTLYQPDSGVYVTQLVWSFQGNLQIHAFEQAWQQMVKQHPILRTAFVWDGESRFLQVVRQRMLVPTQVFDWRGLSRQEQHAQREAVQQADRACGFVLEEGPLLRLILAYETEDRVYVLWSHHHLLLDGWSVPLLLKKVLSIYQQICDGRVPTEARSRPYRDYISWLQHQSLVQAEQFWRRYLSGFSSPTQILVDRAFAGRALSVHVTEESVRMSRDVTKQLLEQTRKRHLTVNTLLQGAWSLLLSHYSRERDVLFGATVAGRPATLSGVESMIGLFINTLPVRASIELEAGIWDWLEQMQEQQVELRQYEHTPLIKIQQWSEVPRSEALFESLLVFENYPVDSSIGKQNTELEILDVQTIERTNYPLTIRVALQDASLSFSTLYDSTRFEPSAIRQMLRHLQTLLEAIGACREARLVDLPLLSSAEQHQLLIEWNRTRIKYGDQLLHGLHGPIEIQVAHAPEAIAVIFGDMALTYEALNQRAHQLAHYLRRLGVGPNILVGLCVERSLEMVVGLLGILKAGGAYVPMDPSYPAERLTFMLQDAHISVLLTQERFLQQWAAFSVQQVCLDADWEKVRQAPQENLEAMISEAMISEEQLAYTIYTSGSTGTPKGVMVSHRNILNFFTAMDGCIGNTTPGVWLAVTSISFDISVLELFWALARGFQIIIRAESSSLSSVASSPAHDDVSLSAQIMQHAVTHLQGTPSLMRTLLMEARADTALQCLRTLLVGGESFPLPLARQLSSMTSASIINMYGPTETAVWSATHRVREGENSVPIGRPIANTQLYILDAQLHLVAVGMQGELYIGGDGVSQGYLQRPDLTAERYLPHPFCEEPGERLYRTGDLVQYLSNGDIEYLGRVDHQVKLRGFRIELGEIEAALLQHEQVRESVVVQREIAPGDQRLVAYVVMRQPAADACHLQRYLQEKLPDYMIPSYIVSLEALPLTPNGKINRQALPAPKEPAHQRGERAMVPHRTSEEIFQQIWCDVLNCEQVGIHDNFFELGGHSLLAMQMVAHIRKMFQVELPLHSLFETPTIAGLAQQIEHALRHEQAVEIPPIIPVSRDMDLPLSFAQQRLWFLDQLEPENPAYNIPGGVRLQGMLVVQLLERGLTEVIQRHESLRTTFRVHEGQPVQVIQPLQRFSLPVVDLHGLTASQRETAVRHLARHESEQPCDLARGPLLRTWLLRLERRHHVLLVTMHHIISDGWSSKVLVHELSKLYQAFIAQQPSPLAPLPLQYADFALWQQQWLQGAVLEAQVQYWSTQLRNLAPLNLPTDHPRPAVQGFRGAQQTLLLPAELHEQLKALSHREGVTLFMTLLAAFQILLARYSGQVDIAVGTPIANRTLQEVEGLIGFFVNTLVLRSDLSGNPGVRTQLARVREVALGAYSYQDLPFEKIVEVLQPERDLHSSPLFQVMFILQNEPQLAQQLVGVTISPLEQASTTAKFDLTLEVQTTEEGLLCQVEYRTDLFEPATLLRFLGHWHTLLKGMVTQPGQRLADLPLLTKDEQRQLLEWNATDGDLPASTCLHQLIEAQVERTPESIAVSYQEESLTYQQLNQQANRMARVLVEGGIGPELLVAVLAERSLPFLSALLAVLKANGVYLPLDPLHPVSRLRHMLQQSQCRVVLTTRALLPLLSQVLDASFEAGAPSVIMLETLLGQAPSYLPNMPSRALPGHLAYIIYTSGSTGVPKGVMVEQQGMLNHMLAKIASVELSAADSVAQNGPQGFDVSLWQSLAALVCGGHVQMVCDEVAFNPAHLLALVQERAISILQLVPSLLRGMLAELRSVGEHAPELGALRWLIPTGDALPSELCVQWLQRYPHIPVLNTYGSTECSDDQCHYHIEALSESEGELAIVPIGFPIPNMRVYVLDQALSLVPIGIVGELYLGGLGVGRGYLCDPVRTTEAFVPDPFGQQAGGRLYKTGDMVRFLATGNLEFLGRRDYLVKVRGYRIELGDIEAVLTQHPAVHESLVVVRDAQEGQGKELVAYVVAKEPSGRLTEELRKHVGAKLPDYMLPRWFVLLEDLPLNANGKVDRRALPAPSLQEVQASPSVGEGRRPMEEVLATIWSAVLGREQESIHGNFFAQGGHSLLATKMIARLRTTLGVELPLRSLFEAPTIAGLSQRVEQMLRQGQGVNRPPIEPISRAQHLPLSFAQQRLWFLDQLDPDNPAYNIPGGVRLRGTLMVQALEKSLVEIVQRHEGLRTAFQTRNGQAMQIIHSRSTFCLLQADASGLASEEQERQVSHLAREEVGRPFNLTQEPLLRGMLLRLSTQEHVLLLNMHHIVSDGWSMEVFVRELMLLYRAFAAGLPSPLPPLPIQYADFAVWQREWLKGEILDSLVNYWKKQLRGATPIEVPTDRPRPTIASGPGAVHTFTLSTQLSKDVLALSRQEGVTLFMTLLTTFQILLYRYTGQQDIIVGTDIANRTYAETEEIIGFFVNLLVLRTHLSAQDTFREVLRSVFAMVLNAHAHQDLPFEKLIDSLQLERTGHQIPLVNALFVLQNTPLSPLELPGLAISPIDIEIHTSKFDFAVFMTERAQQLTGSVNYRTDLFDHGSIMRMFNHFEVLLHSIVASPDAPVETLEVYSEEEKEQRLSKETIHREIHRSKLKVAKRNVIALPEIK